MMEKWELLKDLPGLKAGAIIRKLADGYAVIESSSYVDYDPAKYPDFFRRVPVRWEPQKGELLYWMDHELRICMCWYNPCLAKHESLVRSGLFFRTRDLVGVACQRVRAVLDAYHDEIGE